ncbi:MAG TPA: beta/gamma crystallin-related protein [Allosphingosinicella sp.]|nr:beta/gamma crystallin-related protein [Allosphingosinicella sp.]
MRKAMILLAISAAAAAPAAQAPAQSARQTQTERGTIIFYDQTNYNGRVWEVEDATSRFHWDYHIRSFAIHPGDRWQICARPRFDACIVLDRSIPDTTMVGIPENANIGSVRPAPAAAPAPAPTPNPS